MVTVLNLGGGNKKSWIKDIAILGALALGGYFLYNYLKNGKAPASTGGGGTLGGGLGQAAAQTPPAIADAPAFITDYLMGYGSELTGFTIPAIPDNPPAEEFAGITENLIDFGTGILAINPFTAPVMPIVSAVLGATSNALEGAVKPASSPLPATEMTTPTIPKYTTDYATEVQQSSAPDIVKAKILAGKIF